jgi:hypothetical protein
MKHLPKQISSSQRLNKKFKKLKLTRKDKSQCKHSINAPLNTSQYLIKNYSKYALQKDFIMLQQEASINGDCMIQTGSMLELVDKSSLSQINIIHRETMKHQFEEMLF